MKNIFSGMPSVLVGYAAVMLILPWWSLSFAPPPWKLLADVNSWQELLPLLAFWILPFAQVALIITRNFLFIPIFIVECIALIIATSTAKNDQGLTLQLVQYISLSILVVSSLILFSKDLYFPLLSKAVRSWRKGGRAEFNGMISLESSGKSIPLMMEDCSTGGMGVSGEYSAVVEAVGTYPKGTSVTVKLATRGGWQPVKGVISWHKDIGQIRRLGIKIEDQEQLAHFIKIVASVQAGENSRPNRVAALWVTSAGRRAMLGMWATSMAGTYMTPACGVQNESQVNTVDNLLSGPGETETINYCGKDLGASTSAHYDAKSRPYPAAVGNIAGSIANIPATILAPVLSKVEFRVRDSVNSICQSNRSPGLTTVGEMTSCIGMLSGQDDFVAAYIKSSPKDIHHSAVRLVGLIIAQMYGPSLDSSWNGDLDDMLRTFLSEADAQKLSTSSLKEQLRESPGREAVRTYVFADVFDSYYCNAKTKSFLTSKMPKTSKMFQDLFVARLTKENSNSTSGFGLTEEMGESDIVDDGSAAQTDQAIGGWAGWAKRTFYPPGGLGDGSKNLVLPVARTLWDNQGVIVNGYLPAALASGSAILAKGGSMATAVGARAASAAAGAAPVVGATAVAGAVVFGPQAYILNNLYQQRQATIADTERRAAANAASDQQAAIDTAARAADHQGLMDQRNAQANANFQQQQAANQGIYNPGYDPAADAARMRAEIDGEFQVTSGMMELSGGSAPGEKQYDNGTMTDAEVEAEIEADAAKLDAEIKAAGPPASYGTGDGTSSGSTDGATEEIETE